MPRADSRIQLTGTFSSSTGLTSWTLPFRDDSINTIILSDSYGSLAGTVISVHHIFNNIVYAAGDYSDYPAILGRNYVMSVELSKQFRRDEDGRAIIDDRLQASTIVADHVDAGTYDIVASLPNRANRTRTFTPTPGTLIEEEGQLRTFLNGDSKNLRVYLRNDTPLPCTICSVVFDDEVSIRSRK